MLFKTAHWALLFLCYVLLAASNLAHANSTEKAIALTKSLTKGKKVTLNILYPEGSQENIKPIAAMFQAKTGVFVQLIETTVEDINTKLLLNSATETSDFDIALPATFGIPDLAEAGILADLTAIKKKYASELNIKPSMYTAGDYYKGKFYGYQTDGDAYIMFYNQRWLNDEKSQQRFMKTYNRRLTLPKTWEELDQLMAFFHEPKKRRYGGCMFRLPRYMVWEWWIRFHALGGTPADSHMSAQLNSSEGVKALQDIIDSMAFQHPSSKTNGLFENWSQFSKGECFANIGWGGTQKYLVANNKAFADSLSHAPTPQVSYFNWGWNYVVSKYSKHAKVAYLFTAFATSPEMSTLSVQQNGFFDPFRSEHFEDEKINQLYNPSFLNAHKQAMKTAIPDFYIQGQGQYIQVLQEAITSASEGEVSAQQALDYANAQWNEITKKMGMQKQIIQWKALKKSYP